MWSVSDGTHETHQERYLLWEGQASLFWLPAPTVFTQTLGWYHSHSEHPNTPITVVHTVVTKEIAKGLRPLSRVTSSF